MNIKSSNKDAHKMCYCGTIYSLVKEYKGIYQKNGLIKTGIYTQWNLFQL